MGTPAQKLQKALQTKSEIKTAINNTGCPAITDSDTFASYSSKISDYLVYPKGTLAITENNPASSIVDVTNYKYVDVNVPILLYNGTVNGAGSGNITFTGLPAVPALFTVHIETSLTFSKSDTPIVSVSNNDGSGVALTGAVSFVYVYNASGNSYNAEHVDNGTYNISKQANNTYNITITIPAESRHTPVFKSGTAYSITATYTLQQRELMGVI